MGLADKLAKYRDEIRKAATVLKVIAELTPNGIDDKVVKILTRASESDERAAEFLALEEK
jgi:hypothetical protein